SPRGVLELAIDAAIELLNDMDGDPDVDCCSAGDDLGTSGLGLEYSRRGYGPGDEDDTEIDDEPEDDDSPEDDDPAGDDGDLEIDSAPASSGDDENARRALTSAGDLIQANMARRAG